MNRLRKTGFLLILGCSIAAALIMLTFRAGFYHFLRGDIKLEIFLAAASLIGVLLGLFWPKKKTVVYEQKVAEMSWKGENNSLLSSREMDLSLLTPLLIGMVAFTVSSGCHYLYRGYRSVGAAPP